MQPELDPFDLIEIHNTCALRFNGYDYLDATNQQFPELVDFVKEGIQAHEDQLKNFAAFFALQRFLGKWGGEQLTEQSPDSIAFDFLYLHLYKVTTPVKYAHPDYERQWAEVSPEKREEVAQVIRKRSFGGISK